MLVAVDEHEGVAVDGDVPDGRVSEGLPQGRRDLDIVPVPQSGEYGAAVTEFLDKVGDDGV